MRDSQTAPSRAHEQAYEQALLLQISRASSALQARRDACGAIAAARSLVLLQTAVNESYGRGPRRARTMVMAAARRQFPELTNAYPTLGAEAYMQRLLEGLVSFSPRGTRADCWRHYEMLAAGTLVVASDHRVLRPMLAGLPILLADWGNLSCGVLLSELRRTHAALGQQPTMSHAKLTLDYWTRAVLDDAWGDVNIPKRGTGQHRRWRYWGAATATARSSMRSRPWAASSVWRRRRRSPRHRHSEL